MPNVITYESLYEALRKEKQNTELQKLNKDFFKEAANYLKEKYKILESQKSKESVFANSEIKKTEKQIENTKRLLKELYEKRENKITQLSLLNSRSNNKALPNLLPEEERFYKEILKILNLYRENIIGNVISATLPKIEEPKEIKTQQKENKLIVFTKNVPKFIANDLKVYGPFEPEDIAFLPEKTANLIVKKNRAKEIRYENT